ncbi:oligosaccharide biosynthesis protein Alg14 [Enterococcus sp. DIV0660C]|uniref:oligosaccharide biosynthesis protein Alg14 n=1 Tax=Enterococcus sp. DIV0660C TaxID=2230880 RepID=UPI001A8E9584|nr:oligosaccharide biosynthesis protein Alg14 [Enterococcus sp. DIV0660C]MBO0432562.1 oligosaccharide biosynthesis protein Alg14 [Enterococcus sp. DIV0660C]
MTDNHEILLVAKDKNLYFFPFIDSFEVISGKELFDEQFLQINAAKFRQYQLIIFLDFGFEVAMAMQVRPLTRAKIVVFFWNHFKEEHYELLRQIQNESVIDEVYHFDALEAHTLGLKHNSSFYSANVQLPQEQITTDLFFGATDNGRKEIAKQYQAEFSSRAVTTNYFILPLRGNEQAGYLSYSEYLRLVAKSRGILELLRAGQQGVTLRTFESIYFQKKLVTGNDVIFDYQCYHPDNIFLLSQRSLDELPEFLNQAYQPIAPEILDFFDAPNWAQRFLTIDESIFERYEYQADLLARLKK